MRSYYVGMLKFDAFASLVVALICLVAGFHYDGGFSHVLAFAGAFGISNSLYSIIQIPWKELKEYR